MSERDWAENFDHTAPEYSQRAPEIWKEVRERCPVARSEKFGGLWAPLTYELVRQIAYDTETFSSWGAVVGTLPSTSPPPVGSAPPITSDPPIHREARKILLPPFAPGPVAAMEEQIRDLCSSALDRLGEMPPGSVLDGAADYAELIPVAVVARMLGIPEKDDDLLRGFVYDLLEGVRLPDAEQFENRRAVDAFIDGLIAEERREPRGTLISYLMECEILGAKLSHKHLRGTILLVILAGADTTWSAIGATLHHLATHPEHRHRLIQDEGLMDTAVEEFLRAFAPVSMGRTVTRDAEVGGCPMKKGEAVLLSYPAANRDPEVFPDPDEVVLDRAENRHAAFGLGRHRCIGSHLARLELRLAISEFLARFPDFELADPDQVRWSTGQIRGPRALPLRVLSSTDG